MVDLVIQVASTRSDVNVSRTQAEDTVCVNDVSPCFHSIHNSLLLVES